MKEQHVQLRMAFEKRRQMCVALLGHILGGGGLMEGSIRGALGVKVIELFIS